MRSIEERYRNDPTFGALVNMIHGFMEQNAGRDWTPTELREAAMLACSIYEYNHVRPIVLDPRFAENRPRKDQQC